MGFIVPDQCPDSHIADHHFKSTDTLAGNIYPRYEPLGDDGEDTACKLLTYLVLLTGGEGVDNPFHGLTGVVAVQCAQNEVSGFGC